MHGGQGWRIDVIASGACGLMAACIFASYALFLEKGERPIFLPQISDTWVHPPGSYASRLTVSLTCYLLPIALLAMYFTDQLRRPKSGCCSNLALFIAAFFAVVCLSIVGAVCCSTNGHDCEGNQVVHSVSAVVFFVIFDVYMLILVHRFGLPHGEAAPPSVARRIIIVVGLAVSIGAKLLALGSALSNANEHHIPKTALDLSSHPGGWTATYIAIFEWSDVLLICAFTVGWGGMGWGNARQGSGRNGMEWSGKRRGGAGWEVKR